MENIKEQLIDEIGSEFEVLNAVEFGSDQYKVGVDGLTKLIDRAIEIKKVERDCEAKKESRDFDREKFESERSEKTLIREFDREKFEAEQAEKIRNREFDREKFESERSDKARSREFDNKLQLDNAKSEKRFKLAKVIVDIVVPAASITTGLFLAIKSFRFEEYGTITSTVGKASINKSLSRML